MTEMICLTAIEYPPGKAWRPNDRFDVHPEHVRLFQLAGKARLPSAEPVAIVDPPKVASQEAPRVKRKYKPRAKKA